ncbi:MAG: hypothetical protein ACPGOV_05135 [Magnetovibrionaceae bacterium]
MPFVKRDQNGAITAVYQDYVEEGLEQLSDEDPDLQLFLSGLTSRDPQWMESDLSLARVLEDLIDILIDKRVVTFTDFPAGAQQKLLQRQGLRKEFSYVETLFAEDDFTRDDPDDGFI